jgi:hypothetical protein
MVSLTQKVERIRRAKRAKAGKSRKHECAKGTTPRFPVHIEDAKDCVLPQPPGTQKDL